MRFSSLKGEILAITIGLTLLISFLTSAFGIFSTQTAGNSAGRAASSVLRTQAEDVLTQIAISSADLQDLFFEQTQIEAQNLAAYTENIYNNPSLFSRTYWRFDERVFREGERYLNSEDDISTIFVPDFLTVDPKEKRIAEITAHLDFVAPSILENNENAVAVYHTDKQGFSRYYPNIVLGRVAPPSHSTLEDIVFAGAAPENNPERTIVWSPLYNDPAGRGLMITASAPVYAESGFEGVIGIDVLLTDIIDEINSYSPFEGSYAFLIDKKGNTIAFPQKAYIDILESPPAGETARINLTEVPTAAGFPSILEGMTGGASGFGSIQSGNRELFIGFAPLEHTGFSIAVIAEGEEMLKAVSLLDFEVEGSIRETIGKILLPASLLIIAAASLLSLFFVSRIVRPIQKLTFGAREIGKGNFDYPLSIKSENEIGELATTFKQMAKDLKKSQQELHEYSRGLEQKVKERTKNLAEANARQESLIHFITHEVKGALAKCSGVLSFILEGDFGEVSEKLERVAHRGLSDVQKATNMVMTLLLSANLKRGTLKLNKETFDLLNDAIRPVFNELKQSAEEKGLTITLEPHIEGACRVRGDKEMLAKHVVQNIIDNAIRYTPKGTVAVLLECKGGMAILRVKDSGVGISQEDRARLFTEGGRGKDSVKVNVDSTGYGLFFANELVEAHGGSIKAESEGRGKGSTFVVEIPLVDTPKEV